MDTPRSDARGLFVRAVRRAFADALLAEIRRSRLGRDDAASAGRVSRSDLQYLLKANRQATLGPFISLAEGLGVCPEELMARTMENLSRIRSAETSPVERPPITHLADFRND
jgi:hypothetical protein